VAADRQPPDLLVVDVKLPTADGWKLLETLRGRPEMTGMHALVLTPFTDQTRRGSSFRPETDEVLVTPFRLEDLLAKVERLLGDDTTAVGLEPRAEEAPTEPVAIVPPKPEPSPAAGLERTSLAGNLREFGAASVLMLMDLERRTGVLILGGPQGRGRFYLREGRILRATVDGRPNLRAALAVYSLVTWTEGHFEFHSGEVEGEDEIRSSTSFLLMEGARRQDEDSALAKETSN
jgi:DNA-binding NarL/FixJ family response regulator